MEVSDLNRAKIFQKFETSLRNTLCYKYLMISGSYLILLNALNIRSEIWRRSLKYYHLVIVSKFRF